MNSKAVSWPPGVHPSTTMGFLSEKQSPSVPLGPPPAYPAVFACVLLSKRDRLRLCGFPENVIAPVNEAIVRVWQAGVQKQGLYEGTYEWKLAGELHTLPR
jgi:hypothetical protein